MFNRILSALGVGAPSVDTVLRTPQTLPGGRVTGDVRIQGGTKDARIEQVLVSLVSRVEVEAGDHEMRRTVEFARYPVSGVVQVPTGQLVTLPFTVEVPWETPVTAVGGQPLYGVTVGLRTELVVAGAPDPGDLDPLVVEPLPSQRRVLDAFLQLGFRFKSADVEAGRIYGVPQQLGFYEEIEFAPPSHLSGRIQEVELTFVATPAELYVVLEADRRGGFLSSGGDSFGRFVMPHAQAEQADWASAIGQWLEQVAKRGSGFGGFGGGGHGHHRGGSGMAGMALGAAAGLAGGMVLGEMLDDAGDVFDL